MPNPRAAWKLTQSSFWNSETSADTKSIWKVATRRQTLTVIHEPLSAMALGRNVSFGGLPWCQSWYGLALRGRSWLSEEKRRWSVGISGADCCGAFPSHRGGGGRGRACRRSAAAAIRQDRCRLYSFGLWTAPLN